jgi:hypothetical protein
MPARGSSQEADARPVGRVLGEHDPRAGDEDRRGDVERGRGRVAGDVDGLELELVLRADRHAVAVAVDLHAGRGQHPLGVVPAGFRLHHGGAAGGQQAREQHARLHLRRGHRHRVLDALQRPAGDGERRKAPVTCLDVRAHQLQRAGDAVDRPAADRLVAVERPAPALLARQPAGEQAHQRAGVADVDRAVGPPRRPQAGAADRQRTVAVALDQRAERLHGVQRRVGVGRVEVAGDRDRGVPHRAQQGGAMGDRLVAGHAQRAAQRPRRGEARVHAGDEESALPASAAARSTCSTYSANRSV